LIITYATVMLYIDVTYMMYNIIILRNINIT